MVRVSGALLSIPENVARKRDRLMARNAEPSDVQRLTVIDVIGLDYLLVHPLCRYERGMVPVAIAELAP
jgi:hypothetical protein